MGNVKFDDWKNLDIRVGKVLEVEEHPDADKLFILKVDIGEENPRNIVSGLKSYYEIDELVGRKIIVFVNLKPAKFRGELSEVMILAGEDGDKIIPLEADAEPGTLVEPESIKHSEELLDFNAFSKVKMEVKAGRVVFNDHALKAGEKYLEIHGLPDGSKVR